MQHPAQCSTPLNAAPCPMWHPARRGQHTQRGATGVSRLFGCPLGIVACLKQIVYLKFKIEPRHRIASYHLILGVCNIIQFQRCAEQIAGYAKLLA